MKILLAWVKSGLLFGVVASVFLMLSPNKSYMKHMNMAIGLLYILVMFHPIMQLFRVDISTYADYVKNFLILETDNTEFSNKDREFYSVSLETQLKSVFLEKGYPIEEVSVLTDADCLVEEVRLHFQVTNMEISVENIEKYLYQLFGRDVRIVYE